MSIKINVSLPAGQHYAQYTIEVPSEAIGLDSEQTGAPQTHEQVSAFASATIAAVHKEAMKVQTNSHEVQPPLPIAMPHSNDRTVPGQIQYRGLLESSNTVKINLIETSTRMQMSFYIDKQCHLQIALKVFADHTGRSVTEYSMSFKELRVNATDTATSLGIATEGILFVSKASCQSATAVFTPCRKTFARSFSGAW